MFLVQSMVKIQLISISAGIASFELSTEKKRIFDSGINQVKILNGIHPKIGFLHFKISIVQRVFIVYFKTNTVYLSAVCIHAGRLHLELKTPFIGIYIPVDESVSAYLHFGHKHFYYLVVNIKMEVYVLVFLYLIRVVLGIDTPHRVLHYLF